MPLTIARTAFETVDGYALVDVQGAPVVVGPVRAARKVLERTTVDLARHATYALAVHGLEGSGGAAALNHERGDDSAGILGSFAAELGQWSDAVGFRPVTGMGLRLSEVGLDGPDIDGANRSSAVAAAGRLTGATVVVCSPGEETELGAALDTAGANSVRFDADLGQALATECDVAFVRVSTGSVDHQVAADAAAGRIISLSPLATSARGLAVASRAGSIVVPDFVSAGGQYLALMGIDDIPGATAAVIDRLTGAGVDSFVRACELAEEHLRSWTPDLPFGRPLAP